MRIFFCQRSVSTSVAVGEIVSAREWRSGLESLRNAVAVSCRLGHAGFFWGRATADQAVTCQ